MTIPYISLQTAWQDATQVVLPAGLSPWLLENASLTARLKRHCQQFRVQLLQEQRAALPDFLQSLLPDTAMAQVREVILWCDDKPIVYAQSWLPEQTIHDLRALADVGERPLGDIIFQQPGLVRGPIEVSEIELALPQLAGKQYCWARRSVFSLQQHPLLVSEVFLPAISSLREQNQ